MLNPVKLYIENVYFSYIAAPFMQHIEVPRKRDKNSVFISLYITGLSRLFIELSFNLPDFFILYKLKPIAYAAI